MKELLARLTIRQKFYFLILFIVIGFGIFVWQTIETLSLVKVNGLLFKEIVMGKDLVADVNLALAMSSTIEKQAHNSVDKSIFAMVLVVCFVLACIVVLRLYFTGIIISEEKYCKVFNNGVYD